MKQMMFDIETLDTRQSAIVLSVGAVVWRTIGMTVHVSGKVDSKLRWEKVDEFYRILDIDSQVARGRTLSESALFWWLQQDSTARSEAFNPRRTHAQVVTTAFNVWAHEHVENGLTRFWADPACFDFPIWENLVDGVECKYPWRYNQRYDVRSIVTEASYSVSSHRYDGEGTAHTPVYDCERQIDLLVAAQAKIRKRVA